MLNLLFLVKIKNSFTHDLYYIGIIILHSHSQLWGIQLIKQDCDLLHIKTLCDAQIMLDITKYM